jgi:hypothetical protein
MTPPPGGLGTLNVYGTGPVGLAALKEFIVPVCWIMESNSSRMVPYPA